MARPEAGEDRRPGDDESNEEQGLVSQCQAGSEAAFETLFRRYQVRAWRVAYAVTGDRSLADEATQEAFVRAFRAIGNVRPGRPFGPWFYAIVANQARRTAVRGRRVTFLPLDAVAEAPDPAAESELEGAAGRNEIWDVFLRLPVDLRVVAGLRWVIDWPEDRIAAPLRLPTGTVKSRLHRVRRELERTLVEAVLRELERGGPRPEMWETVRMSLDLAGVSAKRKGFPPRGFSLGRFGRTAAAAAVALVTLGVVIMAFPGPRAAALGFFRTVVHLGGGRDVTPENLVVLPDAVVKVDPIGIGAESDPAASAAGNHAKVLEREEVTIPAGRATLALVERTAPAAAGPHDPTYEYWLVVVRKYPGRDDMLVAYSLQALITGDRAAARVAILDAAENWEVPED